MNLSAWILKQMGWTARYTVTQPSKSVICVAPHTSNWDFIIGKLCYSAMKKEKASFLIKKSWFVFPIGYLMGALGGVPVDRTRRTSITDQMAKEFEKRAYFHLAVTPEGTRKPVKKWKMGFYHIALKANVPIELAYIDYEKKEMGIVELYRPTGDLKVDLLHIYNFYKQYARAKKPQNFVIPSFSAD